MYLIHIKNNTVMCVHALVDVNNAPIINNLPDDLTFDETLAANTLLFTLDLYDVDNDPTNVTYTVLPSQHTNKFTITNTSKL